MHDRILPQHQDHDEYRPHEIRRNSLRASIRSTVAAIPNNSGKIRRGKWTIEEERITERIIKEFFGHQLTDCEEDWSLRTYLAIKLNSSKMRISKKLAHRCIGSVSEVSIWRYQLHSIECVLLFIPMCCFGALNRRFMVTCTEMVNVAAVPCLLIVPR